jgi:glutamyl-tRNA synthetase
MRAMTDVACKTRFAPSPSGYLHLGNVRTALFSALLARRERGIFLLRIEDTDAERSRDIFYAALQDDLRWLGLEWQEGAGAGGDRGPYRQSERGAIYAEYYRRLEETGSVYPCFCTEQQLKLSRRAQVSAGRPPRYAGTCAHLSVQEVSARQAQGAPSTLRFRVPDSEQIKFVDLVRGEQSFNTGDIGDFIIRRTDGTPAFFFCNAIDDALMGVTHVLRGDDHITNTPRQLMILAKLGLPAPQYGHISLIVGADGTPLSKRHGSSSVRELREAGYLPLGVVNHLARLGHHYEATGFMSLDELAAGFDLARLGSAPARHDTDQLKHWQREAIAKADANDLWAWLGETASQLIPSAQRDSFLDTVRPNLTYPADGLRWAQILFTDDPTVGDDCREIIGAAGVTFFVAVQEALDKHGADFKAVADAVKQATGRKGKELFQPLRAGFTFELHGPEMGPLLVLLGVERARRRAEYCIELTKKHQHAENS